MRQAMTPRGLFAAFGLSALFFLPLGLWSFGVPWPGAAKAAVLAPSIAVIRSMSDLAVVAVHVSDVLEGENAHWRGRWNGHGQCVLGVDLSKVTYLEVHPEPRAGVFRLPPPHLVSSKVDHERSEEVYVKWKSWFPVSSRQSLRENVWKQMDKKIARLGQDTAHLERAKTEAECVLRELFTGVGWTVRFVWHDRKSVAGTLAAAASPGKE